jgi:hypothetical protein
MNQTDKFKKISWIEGMSIFFENENLSTKRLDSFSKKEQEFLIYQIIYTLSKYFGRIPGSAAPLLELESSEKFIESVFSILNTWLSGLCDLSIYQIINGLIDILDLKTEYKKWPPNSVMEFYTICKIEKPPYHSEYYASTEKNDFKQLEFSKISKEEKEKKSEEIARNHMIKIYINFGFSRELACKKIQKNKENSLKLKKKANI